MKPTKQIMGICCSIVCVLQAQSIFAQEIGDAKEARKAQDVSKTFPIHGEERCVNYNVGTYWNSKYISEGRDNLSDGGVFSVDGSAEVYGFTVGAWYAVADTISYDEFNMFLEYGFELGPLALSAGYTRLEFLKDEEFDNELSCGTALNCIPYIIPAIDYVYSTEADGSFVELSVSAPVKFLEGRFVLTPYVLEGIDIGYASEDYDGYNNTQVGLAADYAITDNICIVGSVNHSWANQDVRQDDGDDESWLSLGLTASF